jgi:hypothetical protein
MFWHRIRMLGPLFVGLALGRGRGKSDPNRLKVKLGAFLVFYLQCSIIDS